MVQPHSSPASSSVRTLPPVVTKSPQGAAEAAKAKQAAKKNTMPSSTPFWIGLVTSIGWAVVVMLVVAKSGPAHTFGGLPLINWALGISAIVSPVALVWMITAYLQRATDIQSIAEPLRRQLMLVTGESGAAEIRIRRFNQVIREQIELLRSAQNGTQGDLNAVMDRVRQHRNELERFEHASIHQVKEIQEVIRRNMQHIEQLMDDKFTMMRVLDDKLVQNGTGVVHQIEIVHKNVERMLEEIETCSNNVSSSLEKAMHDSKKLADIALAQESSLSAAASSAADTLGSVSSKIDMSVARFLERAGTAREEAERLAVALDTQTRSLDEFSNVLPSRVGEAETILRGVADRLYASEQLAREQAIVLSDKLSEQVDGLQGFLDRFSSRFTEFDGRLQQRSEDLKDLTQRVSGTTEDFVTSWEKSVTDLGDRTNSSLLRFAVANDETRRNADAITSQMNVTSRQFEDAALRMHTLSTESHGALKSMTDDIVTHLTQFENLRVASHQAGEDVQARASSAMQNLQFVLERLLAAREATQSVGSTLVKDLHTAVEQNEHMITRLNEAAQMSVHALGIATESLGKQQGAFADQTRDAELVLRESAIQLQTYAQTAEKGLRDQAAGLMGLLSEVQGQLATTDEKLKGFTTTAVAPIHQALQHIDNSTAKGLDAMGLYGHGLQEQLGRLQQFNGRISDMSGELSRVTLETLSGIENLNTRFMATRTTQEETARQTLVQFADLSDRLQREFVGLDGQTAKAVATLQQAAASVGEQSYILLQNAQNSGTQMQAVTSTLQNEATQIRSILQKQTDDLSADLSRAEVQFTALGENLKQRTESAHALLDRAITHYSEVSRAAAQDLDARTQNLVQTTATAHSKVDGLNAVLTQQLSLIGQGSVQLEAHAAQIGTVTGKTLQNMSALNEKLAITHEAANGNAQQTMARLEETSSAFLRNSNNLSESAQNSVALVQRAGTAFGEQAGKMITINGQIDQNLRQLAGVTSSLADQSAQVRTAMEQQNQRLIAALNETMAQLDGSNSKLQQLVNVAAVGVDQTAARFADMTQSAAVQLAATQRDMQTVADHAETALGSLSINITQQSAAMAIASEQLIEQQRMVSASNETQRAQLVDLFDKLGTAQGAASTLAERTILRLTEALNQIERHLGALSDQSQATIGTIRDASTSLVDQTGVLLQNAQTAEQQAHMVLLVASNLQDQSRQLRETLHVESERTHDILKTLLDKIAAGGAEVRGVGNSVETSLASLQNSLVQQSGSMANTIAQISERQRSLTLALDAQRDVINGLLNRLALAQDETASTAERSVARLADGTQQMTKQLEMLDTRASTVMASVQGATASFTQEVMALNNHAQTAEQQTRSMAATAAALNAESQRTSDALTGLVDRLATSSSQLQESGRSAETTLTQLNSRFGAETATINDTIETVMTRQHGLTAALSEQRQILDNLLSRITSAQDETAVTAERSVARLADGTQQMTKQLEALDTRAVTAMAAIQGATASFTQEVMALSDHAQNAEQQTRSMAATAASLQEQGRQLREQLSGESDRISATLGALMAKLTTSSSQLQESGQAAETTLTRLNGRLDSETSTIKDTIQNVMERQVSLTAALGEQRQILDNLLNRITSAQDETASTAERSVARLADGTQQIAKQLEEMSAQSLTALANVQTANSGFAVEANALNLHAHAAEQQMRGILSVTAGMQEQGRQLRESLHSESERTSAALDGLLVKLASGNTQLQQTGQAAETTLGQLNHRFSSEADHIKGTIQDVMERQYSLTAALGEQRQILDNLLGRITSAQDETASMAERSVARLVDGTQQITRQLEELGAQSLNTLDNIKVASSGFAVEATALGMQAKEAEQQMRGVLSVTAGMQEQAQQLRSMMQTETTNIVEQMARIIGQLDATTGQMKQSSALALQNMNATVAEFGELTRASGNILHQEVDTLIKATDQTENRLDRVGETIRTHLKLVNDIGVDAEQKARQLADTAEFATSRLVTLREGLAASDKDSRTTMTTVAQYIEEVKQALQSELNRLVALSHHAVEQVVGASQQLTANSDELRTSLGNSEMALVSAAATVRRESESVPFVIGNSLSRFDDATQQIKDQAQSSDAVLIKTADRFISVTTLARETMAEEMRRISLVADNATQILGQFNHALTEQVGQMQQHATALSGEQKELVETATTSISQLIEANGRLTDLRQDATVTAEKLTQHLHNLGQRASDTAQRLTISNDIMIKNVDALTQVTQRADNQITGSSNSFREQMERIRSGVQGQIDDINNGLTLITAQLERTSGSLRSTIAGTLTDVERVAQRLHNTGADTALQFSEKTTQMRNVTEEVAHLLSGFGDQLDTLLGRLSMASDGVRRHEGDLVEQMQTALSHLSTVTERLEDGRTLTSSVSEQAVDRLNAVADTIQQQMQNLTTGSQTAAGVMRGIGQIYGDQSDKMNRSVTDSYNQLQDMNKVIDDMQARTDRMRVSLKLQGEELMNSLQQILAQLSMTGDQLSDTVDHVLQEQATKNLQKIS